MNSIPPAEQPPPLNRRHFISGSLATAAAFSIVKPAAVRGAEANAKIRLGLIGCGGRGAWIADLFATHGGYQLAGAADYFADRTEAVAAKHQLTPAQQFNGLQCAEKMIAKGGLDAVAIISPPYFHPAQVRAALRANLHVYLAKPAAVDVPGCRQIKEDALAGAKKGRVFLVDFQTRANEFFIEAMKRVHAGALGDLAFGESLYHAERLKTKTPPGTPESRLRNWVFDQKLSGDIIVEQNIHTLDVMSWAMGDKPPLRCAGTGGRKVRVDVGDCWDNFALTFEYPNNVGIAFSSRQFDAHGEPGGIINKLFGSKGVLLTKYGGDVLIRGGKETFYRGGNTSQIYKEGAGANIAVFHNAIARGDAGNPTLEPAILSNLVAIMGRTAAWTHRPVTWNEIMRSTERLDADLKGFAV
jgi:predicted dehydrogenase